LGSLLALADGTGSQLTATFALDFVKKMFAIKEIPDSQKAILDYLTETLRLTHQEIIQNENLKNSATTLVLAWIIDKKIFLAWSGDSRAYLFRQKLQLLTDDHSIVWKKVKEKKMTPEEARLSADSHLIFQCLGNPDLPPIPDTAVVEWQEGDRLMLCTDGISAMLNHSDLESVISQSIDAQTCCQNLVEACNQAGGHDNMSVIIADFGEVNPQNTQTFVKEIFAKDPVKEVVLTGLVVTAILVVFLLGFLFNNYLNSLNHQDALNEQRLEAIKRDTPNPQQTQTVEPESQENTEQIPPAPVQNTATNTPTNTQEAPKSEEIAVFDVSKNAILETNLKKVLDEKEEIRQKIVEVQEKIQPERKAVLDKIQQEFAELWSKKLKKIATSDSKLISPKSNEEWEKTQKLIDQVGKDLQKMRSDLQKIQ